MPEYLSPGVYIEELDAGPRPIAAVSTSTTGMVGVTVRGPTAGKPKLVTSFNEFQRLFGGFLPEPDAATMRKWGPANTEGGAWWLFPLAVRGFFENGGQRLFVKRVFSSGATPSSAAVGSGLVTEVTRNAAADPSVTRPEVEVRHLFGIRNGLQVNVFRTDTGASIGQFTVDGYDAGRRVIRLNQALGQELRAGRDVVELVAPTQEPIQDQQVTIRFTAQALGDWGNTLQAQVRPMVGNTMNLLPDPAAGGLTVTQVSQRAEQDSKEVVVARVPGAIEQNTAPGFTVVIARRRFPVGRVAAGAPPNTVALTLGPAQLNHDAWPIGQVVRKLRPGTATTQVVNTAVPAGAQATFEVTEVPGQIAQGTAPFVVEIDNHRFPVTGVAAGSTPNTVALTIGPELLPHAAWDVGLAVRKARPAHPPHPAGGSTTLRVFGASQLYTNALVELDNGAAKEIRVVTATEGDLVTLNQGVTNNYLEEDKLRVVEAEVLARYQRGGGEVVEETFSNLHLGGNDASDLTVAVNARSQLIRLQRGPAFDAASLNAFPTAPNRTWRDLQGGADRNDTLSPEDFVGADRGSGLRTGIQALEDIDEVAIAAVPGMWSGTVQSSLIQHCELLKDRFAILDPPDGLDIEGIQTFRAPFDTKYAALYYPWLVVRDPAARKDVDAPPSGHMAGIYARTDVERGVHKAPANAVVQGVRLVDGFAQDITKRHQDLLNPKGINALRFFTGRGHRVWGARTLSSDTNWKYINVRRLFIQIEESIDEGTQWVVFEPNDEPLWALVRQTITNFLITFWRNGALMGSTPDEAFFVACDRSTMSQDDIDNGRLICVIGIAPVFPAEFVIFRIQQKTRELQPA